jgi:hypothetical protein
MPLTTINMAERKLKARKRKKKVREIKKGVQKLGNGSTFPLDIGVIKLLQG